MKSFKKLVFKLENIATSIGAPLFTRFDEDKDAAVLLDALTDHVSAEIVDRGIDTPSIEAGTTVKFLIDNACDGPTLHRLIKSAKGKRLLNAVLQGLTIHSESRKQIGLLDEAAIKAHKEFAALMRTCLTISFETTSDSDLLDWFSHAFDTENSTALLQLVRQRISVPIVDSCRLSLLQETPINVTDADKQFLELYIAARKSGQDVFSSVDTALDTIIDLECS